MNVIMENETFVQFSSAVNDFVFHVAITPWPPQAKQPTTFTFKNGPRLNIIHCFLEGHGELAMKSVFTARRSCFHQAQTVLPAGRVCLFFQIDWGEPDVPGCDQWLGPWEFEVRSDGKVVLPDAIFSEVPLESDSKATGLKAAGEEDGIPF